MPIAFLLRIEHDLVRKRICIAGCDWRYMVFVAVHNCHYLHGSLLQRAFHGSADLDALYQSKTCQQLLHVSGGRGGVYGEYPTSLCLWPCDCDFDQPFFPHDFFLIASSNPCQPTTLPPLFVEELHSNLPSNTAVGRI